MRSAGLFLLATLIACSSPSTNSPDASTPDGSTPDSGTDGGALDGGNDIDAGSCMAGDICIELTGTITYHPVEVAWAQAHGYVLPSLEGATFNVEDAILAQAEGPSAALGSVVLKQTAGTGTVASPPQATFDAKNIDVTFTTLALVGSVEAGTSSPAVPAENGNAGDTLAFSGYGLGLPNQALADHFPNPDTGLQVFVVSSNFVQLLASSIPDYSGPGGAAQMLSDGFVIAQATDPTGTCGAPGVSLYEVFGQGATAMTQLITMDTYYFNDDLSGLVPAMSINGATTAVTSKSGFLIRVNAGSAASYTAMTPGATYLQSTPVYQTHLNGSRQATALSVFFKAQLPDGGTEGGGLDSIGLADGGLTECSGIFSSIDAGPVDAGPVDAGPVDAGPVDAGPVDAGCTLLKVKNFKNWCDISVAGATASLAGEQDVCVTPGPVSLSATPEAGGSFILGPWYGTTGDTGSGDPGTITGTGTTASTTATVSVGASGACVAICCPFTSGTGCDGVSTACQ